jgi:hypothetical protein
VRGPVFGENNRLVRQPVEPYPAHEKPEGAPVEHFPMLEPPMKLTQLTIFLTWSLLQQGQVIFSLSPAKTSFSKVLPHFSQLYS